MDSTYYLKQSSSLARLDSLLFIQTDLHKYYMLQSNTLINSLNVISSSLTRHCTENISIHLHNYAIHIRISSSSSTVQEYENLKRAEKRIHLNHLSNSEIRYPQVHTCCIVINFNGKLCKIQTFFPSHFLFLVTLPSVDLYILMNR